MKFFLIVVALAVFGIAAPAYSADVGVSVSIGQPGFYGRIDIGDYPPPMVIYPQPVIIERVPMGRAPIYLRVPPGHAKHWSRHCREYNACGERVYFVQDSWYQREYVPQYQERNSERRYERGNERHDERGGERRGNSDHRGEDHGRDH